MTGDRFPRVSGLARGYDTGQVDAFTARALGGRLSSTQIRTVAFDRRMRGYQIEPVDAVLDELEDAAAAYERSTARSDLGDRSFVQDVTNQAQVLRARLARHHGDRFARGATLERSYDVEQVDQLCDEIARYFDGETPLTPENLRGAVFAARRGSRGYSERAVDRFVDRVVALIVKVS